MIPLVSVHKHYLVNKPMGEVVDYLTTLEERRKHFEADINGGIISAEPPTFGFSIPVIAFTQIKTRTLLKAELYPKENRTAIIVTLTPNIAFIVLAVIGVIYSITTLFRANAFNDGLRVISTGVFILTIGCILDIISKKVVLGTFERCLHDIHKCRTTATSRNTPHTAA